jgi:hypothetical protein
MDAWCRRGSREAAWALVTIVLATGVGVLAAAFADYFVRAR